MKKNGFIVVFLTVFMVLLSLSACIFVKTPVKTDTSITNIEDFSTMESSTEESTTTDVIEESSSEAISTTTTVAEESITESASEVTENIPETTENTAETVNEQTDGDVQKISLDGALFIGDSRTVGLSEYSHLNEADFFAGVGMTVYNIFDKQAPVSDMGRMGLEDLLSKKQYDYIYVMLGINELGYNFQRTVSKYGSVLEYIRKAQPDATIFIQANLHVTKKRSASDDYINNPSIDRFNAAIAEFADNEKIFYLDANMLFDDSEGNLSEEKAVDNAHIYAKYYISWGDWIKEQTALLLK